MAQATITILTRRCGKISGDGDEWEIDGVSAAAKFAVHGWKEIEQMHTEEE